MESRTSVLIIANSAYIRDSLLVLLRSIPQIGIVHQVEDGPSAMAMGPTIHPAVIVLDHDLPDRDLRMTLSQMRTTWPQAQRLVLLDDEQDRRRVQESGADHVLVKGVRAATVLETIEGLLPGD